jgi:hypothetical protein
MEKLIEVQHDDSVEGLLKDLKGYIEGTDRHEQIMDAFNQQHCEKFTEHKQEKPTN